MAKRPCLIALALGGILLGVSAPQAVALAGTAAAGQQDTQAQKLIAAADGVTPLVIHNIGRGAREEDVLFAFPIIGHYRFDPGNRS